jgi:hypothetical protein
MVGQYTIAAGDRRSLSRGPSHLEARRVHQVMTARAGWDTNDCPERSEGRPDGPAPKAKNV